MNFKIFGLFLLFLSVGLMASCSRNTETGALVCSADNSHITTPAMGNASTNMEVVEPGANVSVDVNFQYSQKQITIQNKANTIELTQDNITITANKPIRVRKINGISRMLVRNPTGVEVTINVTPKEAVEKIKEKATEEKMELNMSDIKIDTDGNTPIYKPVAKKPAKFLGFIPITVPINITVNAQTEETTTKPPFWAFLVSFT